MIRFDAIIRSDATIRSARIRSAAASLFFAGACALAACSSDRDGFVEPPGPSGFGGDGGVTENDGGAPCVADTVVAEPLSLSMLIVMDRSSSMIGPRWQAATSAMIAFADGANGVGTQLGLSVFPPDSPRTFACELEHFAPIVPIGALPANSSAIKGALVSRSPEGSTPMGQALVAARAAMKAHVDATPKAEGILMLVTDGQPTGCGSNVSEVTLAVKAAMKERPPIRTFVIGMDGADFVTLDALAAEGGGASKAFNATSATGDVQTAILNALESARETAVGCEFVLPAPPGGVLDPDTVEVRFGKRSTDETVAFRKVDGVEACGVAAGGFYYDDPAAPKRIILCPTSCEAVRSARSDAKVDLHLGCIRQVR